MKIFWIPLNSRLPSGFFGAQIIGKFSGKYKKVIRKTVHILDNQIVNRVCFVEFYDNSFSSPANCPRDVGKRNKLMATR